MHSSTSSTNKLHCNPEQREYISSSITWQATSDFSDRLCQMKMEFGLMYDFVSLLDFFLNTLEKGQILEYEVRAQWKQQQCGLRSSQDLLNSPQLSFKIMCDWHQRYHILTQCTKNEWGDKGYKMKVPSSHHNLLIEEHWCIKQPVKRRSEDVWSVCIVWSFLEMSNKLCLFLNFQLTYIYAWIKY